MFLELMFLVIRFTGQTLDTRLFIFYLGFTSTCISYTWSFY